VRAWLNLRYTVPERRRIYAAGLKRLGYRIEQGATLAPRNGDILVTWNRFGIGHESAKQFEKHGLSVLVTENAAWSNDFAGSRWYTIARTRHNTAGMFPVGDDARWDDLGVDLPEFRAEGETVILPQRGIGSPPTSMPRRWMDRVKEPGRVRLHPGTRPALPLEQDLANCGRVITWGSGAAIRALLMGIPVTSYMPDWIGEQDNTDAGRLAMFRRLAWAQHRHSEIESGEAFARLLA
jgi:hypothetical protein